jgi:aminoglycoside phosphotransferase (APT) family kinase protein
VCRKVKPVADYDGDAAACRTCLSAPVPAPRKRAAPVTRTVRPTPVAAEPTRRLTGAVGSGDPEVRERRAKRTAWEQLAELHAEEYEQLLQVARRAEGLRT